MDIIVETLPDGAQNEHVVIESPHGWLPRGAHILIEPAPHDPADRREEEHQGAYDNHMVFEGQHYHIRNIRVVDGHDPARTRTAFEVVA